VNTLQIPTAPARLYDYDFEMGMTTGRVTITEQELVKPSYTGRIDLSVVPEIRIAVKEIVRKYDMNQRDGVATLAKFSLSVFQHKYGQDFKTLKNNRTQGFFGGKFAETVRLYGKCVHFFDREPGGRKRMDIFGNKHNVLAPIGNLAEYFNLSASDMAQVILCHGIELWGELPEDATYYANVVQRFKEHSEKFLKDSNSDTAPCTIRSKTEQ